MTTDGTIDDARIASEAFWVDGPEAAHRMAEWVLSPERTHPIVGISTATGLSAPYVDPDAAVDAVGAYAEVWVLRGAREAWALSGLLPERLDVYGGALRVWWPVGDPGDVNPGDHPLLLIYDPDDADRAQRSRREHEQRPPDGTVSSAPRRRLLTPPAGQQLLLLLMGPRVSTAGARRNGYRFQSYAVVGDTFNILVSRIWAFSPLLDS